MTFRLAVSLHIGDLSRWRGAASIVTSSNESMTGNANPSYWRFAGRTNVDGAIRALTAQEGVLVGIPPQKLAPGEAVRTRAIWKASTPPTSDAEWIVHTLVPDGAYGGGEKDPSAAEQTLQQCYLNSLSLASGGPVIAFPALGCGVREWRPPRAADVGFASVVLFVQQQQQQQQQQTQRSLLTAVQFVFSDLSVMRVWAAIAHKRFGEPSGECKWDVS